MKTARLSLALAATLCFVVGCGNNDAGGKVAVNDRRPTAERRAEAENFLNHAQTMSRQEMESQLKANRSMASYIVGQPELQRRLNQMLAEKSRAPQ